jgi:hypothetical protein
VRGILSATLRGKPRCLSQSGSGPGRAAVRCGARRNSSAFWHSADTVRRVDRSTHLPSVRGQARAPPAVSGPGPRWMVRSARADRRSRATGPRSGRQEGDRLRPAARSALVLRPCVATPSLVPKPQDPVALAGSAEFGSTGAMSTPLAIVTRTASNDTTSHRSRRNLRASPTRARPRATSSLSRAGAEKGAVTCGFASWGRLDSNQRPTDYESGLNSYALTCTNALRHSADFLASMDGDGPKWTTGTRKRGTSVEQLDGAGDLCHEPVPR